MFTDFCAEHDLHNLEDLTPKVFKQFMQQISTRISQQTGLPSRNHTIAGYGRVVKIFLSWASTYEDYAGCMKPSIL